MLIGTISPVLAAEHSSYVGPNHSLYFYWMDSTTINGDYVYAKLQGYGSYKQAFAKCDGDGTWSLTAGPTDLTAEITDYGPFYTSSSKKTADYYYY